MKQPKTLEQYNQDKKINEKDYMVLENGELKISAETGNLHVEGELIIHGDGTYTKNVIRK